MADLALKYNGPGFDLVFLAGDWGVDEGFETAVNISLFTDKRVSEDELPFGVTDRGGWWGDLLADVSGDQIGSKLWLLQRAKPVPETLDRAEEYAIEALSWMVEDGIAGNVDADASFDSLDRLILAVTISRPSGGKPLKYEYQLTWKAQLQGQ